MFDGKLRIEIKLYWESAFVSLEVHASLIMQIIWRNMSSLNRRYCHVKHHWLQLAATHNFSSVSFTYTVRSNRFVRSRFLY